MMRTAFLMVVLSAALTGCAQSRVESEYYAHAYADHYHIPLSFLRALITQESAWQSCAISEKGAIGLMQLMPSTAAQYHLRRPCDASENISAGVRRLAYLRHRFHGDLRLVAAAYFAGERPIADCELSCSNPEVVMYVAALRRRLAADSHHTSAFLARSHP